jgi:hypothetical protein
MPLRIRNFFLMLLLVQQRFYQQFSPPTNRFWTFNWHIKNWMAVILIPKLILCVPLPTQKKTTSDKTNMRNLVFNCRKNARALNCFANTVVVQKCVSYLLYYYIYCAFHIIFYPSLCSSLIDSQPSHSLHNGFKSFFKSSNQKISTGWPRQSVTKGLCYILKVNNARTF